MTALLTKFLSRKLIAALSAAAGLFSQHQYIAAAATIGVYIAAQAHVDAKTVKAASAVVAKDVAVANDAIQGVIVTP